MLKLKFNSYLLLFCCFGFFSCVASRSSSTDVRTKPNIPVPEKMDFPVELQNLQSQWQRVKSKYDRLPVSQLQQSGQDKKLALSSISYILNDVQKTFKEEEKSKALKKVPNASTDLDLAESLVGDLQSGRAPFKSRKGDMHLAYRSDLDGTLQPFRLYVPENININQANPLIVGLHGRTGDENSIMDSYGDRKTNNSIFKQKGKEYGFILVTPKGREAELGYQNAAEKDVLDVTSMVSAVYSIQTDKVFLTGHSMGGGGTMLIGLKNPQLYKALAPIAGGLWVAGGINNLSVEAKKLPVQFYHGTADNIVPADPSALQATKNALSNFKFLEYQGEDHGSIFFRSVPEIFKFFSGKL